jgi:hypothetical protein
MRVALIVIAASIVLARTTACSDDTETTTPVQELGTIVYFVPRQHADTDMGAHGHGFVAFVLQKTDENDIKPTFIAHSAAEFVAAYERLPRELQQYGIWLTLQRLAAFQRYSTGRPNYAMERTATRCASRFLVTSLCPVRFTRGPGDRRSSCSR